ncbi:MAG: MucR family transcriptional regulator [Sphingosinicella sp.]|uniref:MucR family transcriptional regulator n=1 Tax=Sphingosinicella sp. TaxID=1917971 RepID=UPI0040377102
MSDTESVSTIELATEITIAWLGNPNSRPAADEVPTFFRNIHATVSELAGVPTGEAEDAAEAPAQPEHVPAVTVRRSLASKDHILSMIDGKPYKTLRRHLSTHGLTPAEYRQRYNLKADYPMVAPTYSEARRAMAHKIGLGQKGRQAKAAAASAAKPKRAPRASTSA